MAVPFGFGTTVRMVDPVRKPSGCASRVKVMIVLSLQSISSTSSFSCKYVSPSGLVLNSSCDSAAVESKHA